LLNDLWEYALDTRVWTQVISAWGIAPFPSMDHSLIPLGNRIVVFGGLVPHEEAGMVGYTHDSALHCFDLQRRQWRDLTTAVSVEHPHARSGHAVISCGGVVLIFGGYGPGGEHFNDTSLLRVWL